MNIQDYSFIKLESESEIKSFNCGDADLNDFLFHDAKNYNEHLLAKTYILQTDSNTIAYFSLFNDSVVQLPSEKSFWNRLNRNIKNEKRRKIYPAVKIGRLAVCDEAKNHGLGTQILDTVKYIFTHKCHSACRFITVDAYASALDFYTKNGFDFLTKNDKSDLTRLMYYDLKKFTSAHS